MARKYSVPFHTTTTKIFEIEAKSPAEAAYLAGNLLNAGETPTHEHLVKFEIGTVKPTLDIDDEG